ncbi:DUF309 domain-containing protein [Indiicoccus explosivorum]|uniref:DUF309 domain-containing protein n=1 Tax=Indiicoccus explosivorum TaxID=1917864 RepID=UPI000B446B9E|nr:DUF309 domain-containing protein [Indiicoccus explosivorum]
MHPLRHPLFIRFLIHFNYEQDYFECHEVGEEYWKMTAPKDKMHPLTGWIQLAVGMYHWRRSNYPGALRSFIRAKNKLRDAGEWTDGIDSTELIRLTQEAVDAVTAREPFQSFLIPVKGRELAAQLRRQIEETPPEDIDLHYLTHKHRLRDRTSIIALREQKKRRNL